MDAAAEVVGDVGVTRPPTLNTSRESRGRTRDVTRSLRLNHGHILSHFKTAVSKKNDYLSFFFWRPRFHATTFSGIPVPERVLSLSRPRATSFFFLADVTRGNFFLEQALDLSGIYVVSGKVIFSASPEVSAASRSSKDSSQDSLEDSSFDLEPFSSRC
jgi:hypothetical protein